MADSLLDYWVDFIHSVYDSVHEDPWDDDEIYPTFTSKHRSTLVKGLIAMRQDYPKLCDVLIKTKEEDVFAHANVLATFSDYFKTLFTTELNSIKRGDQFVVDLSDFSQHSVELVIEFVYNNQDLDHEKFNEVDVEEIMVLCNFTGMGFIQDVFNKVSRRALLPENCCRWYTCADRYGLEALKNIVLYYISYDFKEVVKSGDLISLSYNNFEALLKCDLINCYPEHVLKDAVSTWLNADLEKRSVYVQNLYAIMPSLISSMDGISCSEDITSQPCSSEETVAASNWSVQDCVLLYNSFDKIRDDDLHGILFELSSQAKEVKATPKMVGIKYKDAYISKGNLGNSCQRFIWRQKLCLVHNGTSSEESAGKLNIRFLHSGKEGKKKSSLLKVECYAQHHDEYQEIMTYQLKNNFEVESVSCFGDILCLLLEFVDTGIYDSTICLIDLDTKDVRLIDPLEDMPNIFLSVPSELVCVSFTEIKRICFSQPGFQIRTSMKSIQCTDGSFEDCSQRHFIHTNGKVLCFIEEVSLLRIYLLEESDTECRWVLLQNAPFTLCISLLFAFKGRMFVIFEKDPDIKVKAEKKKRGFTKKVLELWEFDLALEKWIKISIFEDLNFESLFSLQKLQLPRHILLDMLV